MREQIKINDCPFCNKQTEDYFLQTEHFAAIYNISPIVPGHSLVIPKQHIESLFWLKKEELLEFMELGRTTANLLGSIFETNAFDWAIQEKEAAGQSVAHLHLHVVPRIMNDLPDPGDWYRELKQSQSDDIDTYTRYRLTQQQLDELTKKMKNEVNKFELR